MDTTRIMNPSPAVDCPDELEFEMIKSQIETIKRYAFSIDTSIYAASAFFEDVRDDFYDDMIELDELIQEMETLFLKKPEDKETGEEDYDWDYVTSEDRRVPVGFILECPSCGKPYDIRDNGFRPMFCDKVIPINNDTYLNTFRFADYGDNLYYADGAVRARPVSIHKCYCGCLTCTTPAFYENPGYKTEYIQLYIMDRDSDTPCLVTASLHKGNDVSFYVERRRVRGLDMRTLRLFIADYIHINPEDIRTVDLY